ncbi:MAG: diguanylate cyclase [Chloroflexi bacterium]|nr:diguanylate cyclase [Chloroflexota bacterium]
MVISIPVAISTLQRALGDLKVASGELRRSQLALERWNTDLRQKVKQQTKALEERNRHLSIINAVSFALAEPMDDEQALERAVRLVARLLGVRAAQAYTEPRPGRAVALFVTVAPEDVYAPRVPETLLRTVATTGRPLSSQDGVPEGDGGALSSMAACAQAQLPHPLPELGEPYLIVPLVAKGRVLGSFALVGTGGLWSDDDGRHLLLLVGREMGIAIENARLYQEAVEKARREEFVTEVARLLNASDRGERAVPAVLEEIRGRMGADEVLLVTIPGESRDVLVAGSALADDVKPRLEGLARALTRQVSDRYGPFILGIGGEAPLSDRLAADGVTTVAVVPIYMRRGDAGEPQAPQGHGDSASATIPILTGALAMIVGSDGVWGAEDTALLERIADILARRIQADEFVAVQQQRIRELTGLAEVARVMQSGADGERLHHSFALALRHLLRYEALYIPCLDEARNLVGIPSFGQSGRMISSPLFVADDASHPWFSLRTPTQWVRGDSDPPGFVLDDTRYALIVPMRPKGQMLGLVIVALPRPIRSDQAPIVEQAVEQLSLALDGATLYQQATARASHIQALSNLARIVASVVNLRDAFAAVSEEVRWLIPFDRAVMFLLDESEAFAEPYATYHDGAIAPIPMALTSSVASIPINAGTAVTVRRDDPRYAYLDWEVLGDDASEVAAVPIRHGGKTSAVFALVTNSPGAYTIGDLDALDEVAGLLAVTIDRIRLYEQADYSAKHDLLTDLPNYRYLQERLHTLLGDPVERVAEADARDVGVLDAMPRADRQVAALVLDMDNLKVFNDTLGHEVGDHVIRGVAGILRAWCRAEDFVARTGGDEFVVLMEGADADAALAVADRIHAAVQEIHLGIDRADTQVGVSIGIAVMPGDAETPMDLLHVADQAMYDAKFAGGHRTRLASDRSSSSESRALRRSSARLADALVRTLVAGGSLEELAALSLSQRASAVVSRVSVPQELLGQLRLVLAAGASCRFAAQPADRDLLFARYLVGRIEEDW